MGRRNKILSAALAALTAAGCLSISITDTPITPDQANLSLAAIGPGVANLSLGDEYATYQWGLKNDGEFQLTELQQRFSSLDSSYMGRSTFGRSRQGLPQTVEPGDYQAVITQAVSGIDVNIQPAWDLYNQASEKRQVIVALIDTGVDGNHPEFSNALWTNPGEIPGDGIDNDGNGYVDDVNGWNFYFNQPSVYNDSSDSHGTHAAGTISSSKGNGGIAGITDNQYVKIMVLKALGGTGGSGSQQDVIKAIQYAEAKGATICNLSFGSTVETPELAKVMESSKMLFVVAAGNGDYYGNGYSTDSYPVYPSALPYDNIISVANLQFAGALDTSSNFGATSVDIAAPGTYILSTIPGNNYAFMSGTSMAAPMVTGVAAMLYSYRTDITLGDVKNILINSAKKLDSLNGKVYSGGVLDVYGALNYR